MSAEQIRNAVDRDNGSFRAALDAASLEAAVNVWIKYLAPQSYTPSERARLVLTVDKGTAPETREIRLLHAALLRAAGRDPNEAAVSAHDGGASFTDIGAVLGISRQSAGFRINKLLQSRDG